MRELIALAVLIFTAMNACAVQESLSFGPKDNHYNVTFDIENCINCSIEVPEAVENIDSTIYAFLIDSGNASCMVWMEEYRELQDATISLKHANFEMMRFCDSCINASLIGTTISGREAKVARGTSIDTGEEMTMASLWLDGVKCECGPVSVGRTYVEIASDLPADVTDNILRTLTFERT